jgi:membrane peptidoglycan carboxypeptidase
MTGSARRLGGYPGSRVRLSSRTRAVIATRHAGMPARRPRGHIGQAVMSFVLVGAILVGGAGTAATLVGAGFVSSLSADLPDPHDLATLTYNQPTVIYDRTGKVELARFQLENRRVVTFDAVPKLLLDATTTAEDRTFWQNGGFDPGAIVAAVVQNVTGDGSGERGASTITQQLVRARLLPSGAEDGDRYVRKVLEIVQASRVSEAYPGETGKQTIMTAYLNQIYYGHEAYGVAAAAQIYFGVSDLSKLTPAQAALLAGLPKSPSTYDPYKFATKDASGKLVVPSTAPPVIRRNYILQNLNTSRWTQLTPDQLQAALAEPVVLPGVKAPVMKAPHFVWAVRRQLIKLLGSPEAVDSGGYTVITSLDWKAQLLAEKYMTAAAIVPNVPKKQATAILSALKIGAADKGWVAELRGKGVHNGALVAIDYRTGDVLAYVGSAGYYRDDLASPRFQPEDDAAQAYRQPGSAFKPILYSTAFNQKILDPGSLLLDISTAFSPSWAPKDADTLERGPVLVRDALQQSLNIPAIRALQRVGNGPVADTAAKMGVNFLGGKKAYLQSGLAGAIGTVETRPLDLTGAFGTIGNGGAKAPTRLIRSITGPGGVAVFDAPDPKPTQAISPQAAFLMTSILAGNTDPSQNKYWASYLGLYNGPNGSRRPAAAKTGTADSRLDFSTYGFLPPPADPNAVALAVGVWMGNSDHSAPLNNDAHPTSLSTAGRLWHAFVRDYTRKWPVATFKPPKGVVEATIDAWSGGAPGPWTRATTKVWFIDGTQPGAAHAIDQPGILYTQACGGWAVDPVQAEPVISWRDDVQAWMNRARNGIGTKGPLGSTIAYYFGQGSWGGPLAGSCHGGSGLGGTGGGGGGHHHHHHGGG